MFQKISNSWDLVKASAKVLSADKELMIFPIISAIGTILVSIVFFLPLFFANVGDALLSDSGVLGYVALFLFYIVQYSVIFFCNTALAGAALIRLRGGDPTVKDGFRIASSRFSAILGYALIAATVGMLLRIVSDKSKGLGRTLISLVGFAWNVATFLVVPVLAVEGIGPIDAIKRSVALLKKTWGDQIVGNFGLGAVFGLIYFLLILIAIPLFILAAQAESIALLIGLGIGLVMLMVFIGLINSTLNSIYTAAVYRYAAEGVVGDNFNPQVIQSAFRPEKS